MPNSAVQARNISCSIGKNNILKHISFDVPDESLTSILGPSGSGKTTLLNTIAGFQAVSSGELQINGVTVSKKGYTLPPDKRNVGMVFQDHALFPHLTVLENIRSGLKKNRSTKNKLRRLIQKLYLSHLEKRHPHELSAGQQQRTALARALVAEPDIILLDEPFANLNQDLQIEVGIELVDILKELRITAIMVTHDQDDAMAISDHIVVLMNGQQIQCGAPEALYHKPATREVASFLSRGSFIKARYLDKHRAQTPLGTVNIVPDRIKHLKVGDMLDIWLHPEDVVIDSECGQSVQVMQHSWRPLDLLVKVRVNDDQEILVKADQQQQLDHKRLQIKLNNRITYSAFARTET